jgi:hypothetical protein
VLLIGRVLLLLPLSISVLKVFRETPEVLDLLQGAIARHSQAESIRALPVTTVDVSSGPIQASVERNFTGHAERNSRIKAGIVNTPAVDMATLYQRISDVKQFPWPVKGV